MLMLLEKKLIVMYTCDKKWKAEEDIDYSALKKRIKELPVVNSKKIIDDFEKKWKPDVVARYIVETVCG